MIHLSRLHLILGENWHKLRANIRKSLIDQFSGLGELIENWLYICSQNSDISTIPISLATLKVPNAHTIGSSECNSALSANRNIFAPGDSFRKLGGQYSF